MSDFDKEAEREKLRQQFEADRQEREATERMSDLLLQGATMTNRHCESCHSPIFRYEGQAFCPTCQRVVEPGSESAGADAGVAEEPARETDSEPDRRSGGDTPAARIEIDDPDDGVGPVEQPADDREPIAEPASEAEPSADDRGTDRSSAEPSARAESAAVGSETGGTDAYDPSVAEGGAGDSADLATAQASLSRTLVRLAQAAERSGDLGRTRAYLGATREAADALAALKQARQ